MLPTPPDFVLPQGYFRQPSPGFNSARRAFLSHVDSIPMATLLSAVPRSIAQCALDQWLARSVRSPKTPPARPEALKNLEQFIQLKGVADRVHDSVLQH
jgi:hypothetical protein